MCGIAGYWGQLPVSSAAALVHDMNAALAHRGPDGEGMWLGSDVGLGHRRLAIIDVAGGAQPMASTDGRYRIRFQASHQVFLLAAFELWLRQWSPSAP